MNQHAPTQPDVDALNKEYEAYVNSLIPAWLAQNRMRSNNVYEVMRPEERAEVRERIAKWSRYITPLAEAWWKERGYRVVWPTYNSKPMQVYKLETV